MRRPFFLSLLLFFFSCNNINEGNGSDTVYADYKISGEEGNENITCLFKFYENSSQGASLFLEQPATISLDGEALQGDSAGLSGVYYEVQKPADGFTGTHTIVFKNEKGNTYSETFRFQPFRIVTNLGATVPRNAIRLQFAGLQPTDYLRVLLTDTSFVTADINETDTVRDGRLLISRAALRNVASGPVTLHLFKEEEHRLQNPPPGGGKLSITYDLSREFELVDE